MRSEDLVHHFPCGYIGPISDFKNKVDSSLTCPKCSKNLRHIGVDYDKPSIINHCQNCNEVFQDYIVKAKCVHCGTDSDVQYLVSKDINLYKLTKKGRNAATSGVITSEYGLTEDIFGAVDQKTFSIMMHYEQERIKHNATMNTSIALLQIENVFELLRKMGKSKEKTFLTEVIHLIRENITPADFINISNPSMICICLNDCSVEQGIVSMQKVVDKLEELVFNNFNKFELTTEFKVKLLNKELIFEKQLQLITKQLTE
jgi:GGDEF domain-containing protein